VLAEHWLVHGAGHWSGGDARRSFTDASGPDASGEMLRFFSGQRRAPATEAVFPTQPTSLRLRR
jgi:poly(3-hydroxybutyrate) depolymerase